MELSDQSCELEELMTLFVGVSALAEWLVTVTQRRGIIQRNWERYWLERQ
jgi:hypothetical protein